MATTEQDNWQQRVAEGRAIRDRLMAAVAGLDLTEAEMRTVEWVRNSCDVGTAERIAGVIEKARRAK